MSDVDAAAVRARVAAAAHPDAVRDAARAVGESLGGAGAARAFRDELVGGGGAPELVCFAWMALSAAPGGEAGAVEAIGARRISEAYIRSELEQSPWDDWVYTALAAAVSAAPSVACAAVVATARAVPEPVMHRVCVIDVCESLGTGVLEDLLVHGDEAVLACIEDEAPRSHGLRRALRAASLRRVPAGARERVARLAAS